MPAGKLDPDDVQSFTRVILRPLGSPPPLGFYAFGVGVMLVSAVELRWIQPADAANVPLVLLGFVAPAELLACVLAYLARDTASATTLGIFALSWVAQSLVLLRQDQQPSTVLGVFLILLALMMAALALVGYKTKPLVSFILGLACLRSIASALVKFQVDELKMAAAILGILLAGLSLYGGTAFLIEDMRRDAVLPLFRKGPARAAIHGGLGDQLKRTTNEAGVRQQL